MNSLTEVEEAIQKLSTIEVRQLAEWLQTYLNSEGNTEHELLRLLNKIINNFLITKAIIFMLITFILKTR